MVPQAATATATSVDQSSRNLSKNLTLFATIENDVSPRTKLRQAIWTRADNQDRENDIKEDGRSIRSPSAIWHHARRMYLEIDRSANSSSRLMENRCSL